MKARRIAIYLCLMVILSTSTSCIQQSAEEQQEGQKSAAQDYIEEERINRRTEKIDLSYHDLFVTLDGPVGAEVREAIGGDDGIAISADGFVMLIIRDEDPKW